MWGSVAPFSVSPGWGENPISGIPSIGNTPTPSFLVERDRKDGESVREDAPIVAPRTAPTRGQGLGVVTESLVRRFTQYAEPNHAHHPRRVVWVFRQTEMSISWRFPPKQQSWISTRLKVSEGRLVL